MTAVLACILVAVAVAIYLTGGYSGIRKPERMSKSRVLFDTIVKIDIEGPGELDYSRIYTAVWEELDGWERELDLYDTLSDLDRANRCDSQIILPKRLASAVGKGLDSIIPTGGHFDIRIGEITALWDFAGDGVVPETRKLSAAIDRMHRPIRMRGDTLVKSGFSPRLDLGGIAKGLAADAVFAILDSIEGVERFIIDLGGNIRVKDEGGKAFEIGVQSPESPDKLAGKFSLASGKACATAGDYQRFFVVDGIRYHHILNPANGVPARGCSAVTVLANDAVTADIMSTALFVMGPEAGSVFLESNSEIKAVFLDSTGTIIAGNFDLNPVSQDDR